MVTPSRLFTTMLALMGLLLAGCDPAPVSEASSSSSSSSGPGPSVCDLDLSRLMLKGWASPTKTPLENPDDKGGPPCVVLYRFEVPRDGRKTVPVGGVVYRTDNCRPLDIHGHLLSLPGGVFLGEHQVSAYLDDVLSGTNGHELIVKDTNEDNIVVQVSIFEWQESGTSEDSEYKSRGWFVGDGGVYVEPDKVTVLKRRLGTRSQLADRLAYLPQENKTTFYKKDNTVLVNPATVDLVSLVMPSDPATSEYPEKPLLAFYESFPVTNSAKLEGLVEAPVSWLARNGGTLGCLLEPQLSQVFVQDLNTDAAPEIPTHIENIPHVMTDTIPVKGICRFNMNGKVTDKPFAQTWLVRWDRDLTTNSGRWQLLRLKP